MRNKQYVARIKKSEGGDNAGLKFWLPALLDVMKGNE
jgi:hypothetical protein